jgi:hypothetical protein
MVGERVERASAASGRRGGSKPPARRRLFAEAVGGVADWPWASLLFKGQ